MANDLISPEIMLIEKLEETESRLSPVVWQQLKNEVYFVEECEAQKLPAPARRKIKMFFSDFVHKAISLSMEIKPEVNDEARRQMFRLYLFSCQQAIHNFEVRRNPLILGFHALNELKTALTGIMVSYRLITPSSPYSWSREFFEKQIFVDKGADGHAIVRLNGVDGATLEAALNADIVSDWLIYRTHDANGIKTLMDIRNNLLTLPDYQRGGSPAAEFSRFERKMAEQRNKKEQHKNEALDLEFRKTLVRAAAERTAANLVYSGASTTEILEKAYTSDLRELAAEESPELKTPQKQKAAPKHKALPKQKRAKEPQTSVMDEVIQKLLEE